MNNISNYPHYTRKNLCVANSCPALFMSLKEINAQFLDDYYQLVQEAYKEHSNPRDRQIKPLVIMDDYRGTFLFSEA